MCEHNVNGICLNPARKEKGLVGQPCEHCHHQNFAETPDKEKEYIHPVFL